MGQVDLLATIADVVGSELKRGQGEDSVSFLPVLRNERSPRPSRPPLIHHGRGQFAIRAGRWKLVFGKHADDRGAPGPPAELFDLAADPAETWDVSIDNPAVVEELRRRGNEIILRGAASAR